MDSLIYWSWIAWRVVAVLICAMLFVASIVYAFSEGNGLYLIGVPTFPALVYLVLTSD